MRYQSTVTLESEAAPGVRVRLRRMSFGGRLELARALQTTLEQMDAALARPAGELRDAELATLAAEADAAYLRWGVLGIEGLDIDGAPASVDSLLASGPEPLVLEILRRIKADAGLDESERKNSESPSISCAVGRQDPASDGSATPADASASTAHATAAATPNCFVAMPSGLYGCGVLRGAPPVPTATTTAKPSS